MRHLTDDKPTPRVPEPLFPVLRRLGAADVQRARSWLLAWLLDRLGQRVQEPDPPQYVIERWADGTWAPVAGRFYRQWVATQIAQEFVRIDPRRRYRVVGPGTDVRLGSEGAVAEGVPDGR